MTLTLKHYRWLIVFLFLVPSFLFAQVEELVSPGDLSKAHSKFAGIKNCNVCHGSHRDVLESKCLECHKDLAARISAGKGFHADKQIKCMTCHTEHLGKDFDIRGLDLKTFSHEQTGWKLEGLHANVKNCASCHKTRSFLGLSTSCQSCHRDPHRGALPSCETCHSVQRPMKQVAFDHSTTRFALNGAHQKVPCLTCHKNQVFKGLPFANCTSCHKDPHKGTLGTNCTTCHNNDSWQPSGFKHDKFPLVGQHKTVPCQKCHPNGQYKLPAYQKCADCHKDPHLGQFANQACEGCHSVEGFKPAKVNHEKFKLENGHDVPCEKCHKLEKGKFPAGAGSAIRYKPMRTECAACHKDVHGGQFGQKCEQCHTTASFQFKTFDHSKTRFPLDTNHAKVECQKCHVKDEKTGVTRYKPLATNCASCHKDPHLGQFGKKECEQCHTPQGVRVDHASTQFPLLGKHLSVPCEKCHVREKGQFPAGTGEAVRYKPILTNCSTCHQDYHRGQFKEDCAKCHTTQGFKPTIFDHAMSNFKLEGAHLRLTCERCHKPEEFETPPPKVTLVRFKPVPQNCDGCHKDPHKGQFGNNCAQCHTPEKWITESRTFHNQTRFPLNGRHLTVPCQSCHLKKVFAGTPITCYECHWVRKEDDVNRLRLGSDCQRCHTTSGWSSTTYNHSAEAGVALSPVHQSLRCDTCHVNRVYAQVNCSNCHAKDYESTTRPNHRNAGFPTNCELCHKVSDARWEQASLNHAEFFPLSGRHATASCQACHINNVYKGTPRECYGCHRQDYDQTQNPNHKAAGFPTDCQNCHKYTDPNWGTSNFNHQNFFPLVGRHATAQCASCHQNGIYKGTPRECYGCHRADYEGTTNPDHRQAGFSTNCESCHKPSDPNWGTQFNHNNVFPLVGRHGTASCGACHKNGVYKGTPRDCIGCHRQDYDSTKEPNHKQAGFSTNCESCHKASDSSWRGGGFNHNNVFPLVGRHGTISCESCHKNGVYKGTPRECIGCHRQDYDSTQNPNHKQSGFSTNCESCHRPTDSSWKGGAFNHNSVFPLAGRHAAASCASCHKNGVYKGTPRDCYGCHRQDYDSTKDPNHRQSGFSTNCDSCHRFSDPDWSRAKIDHNQFFRLVGRHASISCEVCHKNGVFKGTPSDCYGCHRSDYDATRDPNHRQAGFPTNCEACHNASDPDWNRADFDHNQFFQLAGRHATTPCASCHKNGQYKGTPRDCYGCHRADYDATRDPNHRAAGFPTTCDNCHRYTDSSWDQGKFDHSFPITSGKHAGNPCSACHTDPNNFRIFTCLTCHTRGETDDHHKEVKGYRYESNACLACHPDGRADD